ncbi:O-antigen ligase family protein [Nitrospinae bacterium]|nr:O-antigen ligase family protein [Nitrospinota bacterium]
MPAAPEAITSKVARLNKNFSIFVYFLSTLFMVFFSVHAVQKWPSLWAQGAISLACILPAIMVLFIVVPDLIRNEKWPIEIKFILIIVTLGFINICFSENQLASLKGMGLFLMSGILAFSVSYSLFNSKQAQKRFFYLCSFCFVALLFFGVFEFFQPGGRILLLSSNPIPAGSILILLSGGPLILATQAEYKWQKIFWISCLHAGVLLVILIAQRGPVLAIIVMAFIGGMGYRKGTGVLILVTLVLVGIGYQFKDNVPLRYKKQLLRQETVMVRVEFYRVALEVMKEKPVFGLGFNSSLKRFIQNDYEPKTYSENRKGSFYLATKGFEVFDNMFLSFLGEMGGLFTLAYIGLLAYILRNIYQGEKFDTHVQVHVSLLLIVIAGFLVHSATFDSLKYPHLNWVFHSFLGLLAQSHYPREE